METPGGLAASASGEPAGQAPGAANAMGASTTHVGRRIKGLDRGQVVRHTLFALLVGVIGAAASIILCLCVDAVFGVFEQHRWLVWLLPVLGVASIGLYHAWKLPLDLTTHHVIMKMRQDEPISSLLAPGVLAGTCASILGGGSVGKEAAALQMGASLGSLAARPFHLRSIYRKNEGERMDGYAAATGMAAAFSALFFAPLGSALFVLELSRFKSSISKHVWSIVLACLVAFLIAQAVGIGDIIDKVALPEASWGVVGQCLVVGLAASLFGSLFASALQWVHDLTKRVSLNYALWTVLGGVLFACLLWFCDWSYLGGSGGTNLNAALHGQYGPWDFAIKLLLTIICLGFWFKGGEIMPSFCIGGLLGASCTAMTGGDPAFGAAVGAMTLFAAFSGCPLAALVMGCEIFGLGAAPWLALSIVVSVLVRPSASMYGANLDQAIRAQWHKAFRGGRQRYRSLIDATSQENHANVTGVVTEAEAAVKAFGQAIEASQAPMEEPPATSATKPAPGQAPATSAAPAASHPTQQPEPHGMPADPRPGSARKR